MARENLVKQAKEAAKSAKHNLKWMKKHPDKFDQAKKADMEAYLEMMIRFAAYEQKNTHSAKCASVLSSLKDLFVSIVPHSNRKVVVKA